MTKRVVSIVAITMLSFEYAGCMDNPVVGHGQYEERDEDEPYARLGIGTYLDEPIVMEASDVVLPYADSLEFPRIYYYYDLSPILDAGDIQYEDFFIRYSDASSCISHLDLYDFGSDVWDRIIVPPYQEICSAVITPRAHFIAARGFDPSDYVSDDLLMQMERPASAFEPRVSAITYHEDYCMVPITVPQDPLMALNIFFGLGYEDGSFWISSETEDRIYKLSMFGEIMEEIRSPSSGPGWLAGDGKELLVRYPAGHFVLMEADGEIIGAFESSIGDGPLSLSGDDIWVADGVNAYDESSRLYCLDLDRSLDSGFAAIVCEIVVADVRSIRGLTCRDDRLLIIASDRLDNYGAVDSLHICSVTGDPIVTYALPVRGAGAMVTDDKSIWVMHIGPRLLPGGEYCRSDDPVISRFRLR